MLVRTSANTNTNPNANFRIRYEVARLVQNKNTYRVLVGEVEGKAVDRGILLKEIFLNNGAKYRDKCRVFDMIYDMI